MIQQVPGTKVAIPSSNGIIEIKSICYTESQKIDHSAILQHIGHFKINMFVHNVMQPRLMYQVNVSTIISFRF